MLIAFETDKTTTETSLPPSWQYNMSSQQILKLGAMVLSVWSQRRFEFLKCEHYKILLLFEQFLLAQKMRKERINKVRHLGWTFREIETQNLSQYDRWGIIDERKMQVRHREWKTIPSEALWIGSLCKWGIMDEITRKCVCHWVFSLSHRLAWHFG